jgi:hypothetical protein
MAASHPAMKTFARPSLVLLAGFFLAGCATKSAQLKPPPTTVATLHEDFPESSRDHWMRRDLEDKIERTFEPTGSR